MTLRRAVGVLINEGLIQRVPGKGLFVRAPEVVTRQVQVVAGNLAWETLQQVWRGVQSVARDAFSDAVRLCAATGAWLILDLHRFRAPTEQHRAFWLDAAARYKNNPAALFELFNEPHDITWEVWRNGGEVTDKVKRPATTAPIRSRWAVSFPTEPPGSI